MSYFIGEALQTRIRRARLDGLYDLLQRIANGEEDAVWPQPFIITVLRDKDIGPTRNLLYSMLANLNLKSEFTVRLISNQIILDQTAPVLLHKFGDTYLGKTTGQPHQHTTDVLGPEFDLNDQELFPTKDDHQARREAAADLAVVRTAQTTNQANEGEVGLEYSLDDRDDPDPVVAQFLTIADMGKNSPIFKTYHRLRLIVESPETYEPDRAVAASKMVVEKRSMEKAIRAAGLLAAPLSEEED